MYVDESGTQVTEVGSNTAKYRKQNTWKKNATTHNAPFYIILTHF
jgi:hypothetical protein